MNEHDAEAARAHAGGSFSVRSPTGEEFKVRLVVVDEQADDRFATCSPTRCSVSIQHDLWTRPNAPDIRREEIEAFEFGYNAVNEDLARAVVEELEGVAEPVVMVPRLPPVHPARPRAPRASGRVPSPLRPHPVDPVGRLAGAAHASPEEIFAVILANDIVGFHTRSYRRNFLQRRRDLMDLEVDFERGVVWFGEREVWVRAYPLPIDHQATRLIAAGRARERARARAADAAAGTS